MAILQVEGDEAVLRLSLGEKIFGFHTSPKVALSKIEKIEPISNFWNSSDWGGVRAPGTGIPWVVGLGTWRRKGRKSFCAIYKREPGFKITFTSTEFEAWLFSSRSIPEALLKYLEI